MLKLQVMWKDKKTADIEADLIKGKIKVTNYTDKYMMLPFGLNENPNRQDFEDFLEDRCFPKERFNCKQLLEDLDLDFYDPLAIIEKTHGRQFEDYMWIKFEGEELEYERDIKLRD